MQEEYSSGITAAEIARLLSASIHGDSDRHITDVASLASATSADLAFFTGNRRENHPQQSQAGAILCTLEHRDLMPETATVICVAHPQLAFIDIVERLRPPRPIYQGIDPTARIDPSAQLAPTVVVGPLSIIGPECALADGVEIGPGCILGRAVSVGAESRLIARVTILDDCRVGERCVIQPGAVIGSDGFGLVQQGGQWRRVPQLGRVLIGDDVDIGANTTVDRGALDDTLIGNGAKLDNLIQIAHNVEIGEHSAIAGCAGLAGSSVVGKHCTLGGGVGLAGHLSLADGVHVTGMSMVTRSIHKPGVYSAGTPLDTNEHWLKNAARFKQLDRMAQRLQALESNLSTLQHSDEENP